MTTYRDSKGRFAPKPVTLTVTQAHIDRATELQKLGHLPSSSCPIALAGKELGFSSWGAVYGADNASQDILLSFARLFDAHRTVEPITVQVLPPRK